MQTPKHFISPSYTADKLDSGSFDDRVGVFEDQIRGYLLKPAAATFQADPQGYAAVGLTLAYFEGIASYLEGQDSHGRSADFFWRGFRAVFEGTGMPEDRMQPVASALYKDARCGFFHDALMKNRIFVSEHWPSALRVSAPEASAGGLGDLSRIDSIVINPRAFLAAVEEHLAAYLALLRDPSNTDARQRFDAAWSLKGPLQERVIVL